jgi:hypothetical protein
MKRNRRLSPPKSATRCVVEDALGALLILGMGTALWIVLP